MQGEPETEACLRLEWSNNERERVVRVHIITEADEDREAKEGVLIPSIAGPAIALGPPRNLGPLIQQINELWVYAQGAAQGAANYQQVSVQHVHRLHIDMVRVVAQILQMVQHENSLNESLEKLFMEVMAYQRELITFTENMRMNNTEYHRRTEVLLSQHNSLSEEQTAIKQQMGVMDQRVNSLRGPMHVVTEARVLERLQELESSRDQTNGRLDSTFGRVADRLIEIMEKQEQDNASAHGEINGMRQELISFGQQVQSCQCAVENIREARAPTRGEPGVEERLTAQLEEWACSLREQAEGTADHMDGVMRTQHALVQQNLELDERLRILEGKWTCSALSKQILPGRSPRLGLLPRLRADPLQVPVLEWFLSGPPPPHLRGLPSVPRLCPVLRVLRAQAGLVCRLP